MNQTNKNTILKKPEASLFGKTSIGLNRNFDLEVIHSNHITPASEVENDIYYYHTDHLGSSSWITYTDGSVTQYLQNLPFGEPFIDQRCTSYDVRFKFTGKEMDTETGYQYFGARYYNSDISVWLSVDPMSDMASNLTPYRYAFNNPTKYIDQNGLFESRKEARQYKKDNNIKGGISKCDGLFEIYDRKNKLSYYKDPRLSKLLDNGGRTIGKQNSGVIISSTATANRTFKDIISNLGKKSNDFVNHTSNVIKALSFMWETRLIGKEIPDVITLSLDLNSTFVRGGQMSYTVNLMTRGDKGVYLTRTEMETKGFGPDWGLNIGGLWYERNPATLDNGKLAGPVESASGGFLYGGNYLWARDANDRSVTFKGGSLGAGLTLGGSYGKGKTYLGWK